MFEKHESAKDFFAYKLGSALKMERTTLEMLGDLEEHARRDGLKQQFRHHADETRQQISNLEKAFSTLGLERDEHVDLVIEAIDKEGKLNIKRATDGVVDAVILAGAAATEHHEIAVYETLIAHAEAQGHQDVSSLLRQNLEQEQHTLGEVRTATEQVAREVPVGAA
jgi:ferritin-like metal-binding protein YciE